MYYEIAIATVIGIMAALKRNAGVKKQMKSACKRLFDALIMVYPEFLK
jgi:hypothetical protein